MTTPRPRRVPRGDASHADLLADLARVLPATAGLAQILGTAAGVPAAADADASHAAYTRLLTDLADVLPTSAGVAAIVATESIPVGVAGELTTALDTDRGLADILGTTPGPDASAPVAMAAALPVSDDEPPAMPSVGDDLATIYFAPANQRLQLRLGSVSRAARDTLRQLQTIHEVLVHIPTGAHPLDSPLNQVPAVLERQRGQIARATTLMAQALPSHGHPQTPGVLNPEDVAEQARPDRTLIANSVAETRKVLAEHNERLVESVIADQQRAEEDLDVKEGVFTRFVRSLGEEHPETLTAQVNLAASYRAAGRIPDAISLHEKVLADALRLFGEEHPVTLTAQASLTVSYWAGGRILDATSLQENVVVHAMRLLGEEHPETLTAQANLAALFLAAGRTAEAISLHEKVLADALRLFGEEHPKTLSFQATLAASYRAAGRTVEAISLHEKVLADALRLFGEEHPETLTARAKLAGVYRAGGRIADAIGTERRLIDSVRAVGQQHRHTPTDRAHLAGSTVSHDTAVQSALLLEQVADELAALADDLVGQPPSPVGKRLLRGCGRLVTELTETAQQLWAALSDFLGEDLRAVTVVPIEELDGVRWSDGTAGTYPTRWPAALDAAVREHSAPVDGLAGVWEIGFGAAISPGRR